MNIGAILIGAAIIVLAVPYVINPFLDERKKRPGKDASLEKEVNDEQRDALAAIRDLDFDFQTGKVTQEDYSALRERLFLEAAESLQKKKQAEDEEIEEMIRVRQQSVKQPVAQSVLAESEKVNNP